MTKQDGDPRAYHLWSFWLSSYGQSLHWSFPVVGWLRLVQNCLKVIQLNPPSFPCFCKVRPASCWEVFSWLFLPFLSFFPLTGITSNKSLAFLFSFWHLFPRDPELSLGSHYWPLWDIRLVISTFFGGEGERACTYMSVFITSLRRPSESSITLELVQNTISKT